MKNPARAHSHAAAHRAACLATVVAPGCRVAPSVNILGSFFPAWLISVIGGIALTIIARQVFLAADIDSSLWPRALVYPCLACLFILGTWLVLFSY